MNETDRFLNAIAEARREIHAEVDEILDKLLSVLFKEREID